MLAEPLLLYKLLSASEFEVIAKTLCNESGKTISDKANIADLATVATSGNYNDLSNKPTIPSKTSDLINDNNFISDSSYVHTDNNYTNAEKSKLSGIASGAEVNVNADWNAVSGDA